MPERLEFTLSTYERFVQLQETELEYLSALRDARSKRDYLRSKIMAKAKDDLARVGADKRLSESKLEDLVRAVVDDLVPLP